MYHQLYAGRELIGNTEIAADRVISGQVSGVELPIHLQVIAVDEDNLLTNYGDTLPTRPYNRARIISDLTTLASDVSHVILTASATAGGAVVSTNELYKLKLDDSIETLDYLDKTRGTGTWSYALKAYDNTEGGGNASTAGTLSVALVSYPSDNADFSDSHRINAEADEGILTIGWGA
jgi:hypothetical protein